MVNADNRLRQRRCHGKHRQGHAFRGIFRMLGHGVGGDDFHRRGTRQTFPRGVDKQPVADGDSDALSAILAGDVDSADHAARGRNHIVDDDHVLAFNGADDEAVLNFAAALAALFDDCHIIGAQSLAEPERHFRAADVGADDLGFSRFFWRR